MPLSTRSQTWYDSCSQTRGYNLDAENEIANISMNKDGKGVLTVTPKDMLVDTTQKETE